MNKKTSKDKQDDIQIICVNRKAKHDYFILHSIECGIVLLGPEVKALRDFAGSLEGSYAMVANGELWLLEANITSRNGLFYKQEPKRKRKLLLKKAEIRNFAEKAKQKGNTLVPLKLYFKNGKCKVELAVATGKATHDKRQALKEKDFKKEIKNF